MYTDGNLVRSVAIRVRCKLGMLCTGRLSSLEQSYERSATLWSVVASDEAKYEALKQRHGRQADLRAL